MVVFPVVNDANEHNGGEHDLLNSHIQDIAVLPAPVGPTIAVEVPRFMTKDKPLSP